MRFHGSQLHFQSLGNLFQAHVLRKTQEKDFALHGRQLLRRSPDEVDFLFREQIALERGALVRDALRHVFQVFGLRRDCWLANRRFQKATRRLRT